MSDTIVMRHPTLPPTQEIEVPKDAMPHYTAAGWQLVPAEELQRRADEKAKAEAAARAEAEAAEALPEPEQAEAAAEPESDEPEDPAETPTRPARSRAKAPKKGEE